jgi:hypothetical protein
MNSFNGIDLVLVITVVLLVLKVLDLRKQLKHQQGFVKTCHRELNDIRIRYEKLKSVPVPCPNKNCTYHHP